MEVNACEVEMETTHMAPAGKEAVGRVESAEASLEGSHQPIVACSKSFGGSHVNIL